MFKSFMFKKVCVETLLYANLAHIQDCKLYPKIVCWKMCMSKHCYTLIWCIFKIVCLKMCMLKIFMSNDVYIKKVCAQKCVDQPEL